MKIGRVIGKVVLSQSLFPKPGGRLLLVSPLARADLEKDAPLKVISSAPSLVVYDELGAQEGDLIGITEGGEATRPFDFPMPVDAYCACLFDAITIRHRG